MNDTIQAKKDADSRSRPDRRQGSAPGRLVTVDDQVLIQLHVVEHLDDPDAAVANFVMEGMASFGSQLAEEVEDAKEKSLPEFAAPLGDASFSTAKLMLSAVENHQEQIAPLSRSRRRAVARTLDSVVSVLLDAAYEKDVSAKQLEEQGQAAIDTLKLLVQGGADRLETLIDALEAPAVEGYVDVADEDAEARARLRLHALYQRVIRDSFSVAELTRQMRLSRQRLKQLREQDRLFAIEIPFHRGWLYPRWQFELATGKPRGEMPRLIAAAREAGLDAIGFHVLINNTAAGGGLSPLDLLEAGDEAAVIGILRGADQ